jgi:hypothetical protein
MAFAATLVRRDGLAARPTGPGCGTLSPQPFTACQSSPGSVDRSANCHFAFADQRAGPLPGHGRRPGRRSEGVPPQAGHPAMSQPTGRADLPCLQNSGLRRPDPHSSGQRCPGRPPRPSGAKVLRWAGFAGGVTPPHAIAHAEDHAMETGPAINRWDPLPLRDNHRSRFPCASVYRKAVPVTPASPGA